MDTIKKLWNYASDFIKGMTVWDMGALKICLFSLGLLAGSRLTGKHKNKICTIAAILFSLTYAWVMGKFMKGAATLLEKKNT